MPIIKPQEVIDLLGNTSLSSKIPAMQKLIPAFQGWFTERFNNWFETENWMISDGISFTAGSPGGGTIADTGEAFLGDQIEFKAGMDFSVRGSVLNDGIYTCKTVVAATITLDGQDEIQTEDFAKAVKICRVVFPRGLKYWVARAIELDLQETAGIVETSNTKQDLDIYPEFIMQQFSSHHKFKWSGR